MTITEPWNETETLMIDDQNSAFGTITPVDFGFSIETEADYEVESLTDNEAVEVNSIEAGLWEDQASCRTVDNATGIFFSEELADIVAAKRVCAECPVIAPCLEGAIHRAEPCGVWGGQLFANGRVQAQKRRRGRPPKVPRPEDQLPVVPVPEHLRKLIA